MACRVGAPIPPCTFCVPARVGQCTAAGRAEAESSGTVDGSEVWMDGLFRHGVYVGWRVFRLVWFEHLLETHSEVDVRREKPSHAFRVG